MRTGFAYPRTEAFITCNEEPDLGRIAIPMRNLAQYSTTLSAMSKFIAGQMALGNPRPSAAGASFLLGTIRGRNGNCPMTVGLEARRLMLRVRGEQEPLVHALLWDSVGLVDRQGPYSTAGKSQRCRVTTRASRPPDRSIRHDGVRRTGARHRAIFTEAKNRRAAGEGSWTTIAAAIAQTNLAWQGMAVPSQRPVFGASVSEMRRRERKSFRSNHGTRMSQ